MSLELKLPESLFFPVEITKILVSSGQQVTKRQPLLSYKYWNRSEDGIDEDGNEILSTREFYAEYESPCSGQLTDINVKVGDRINGGDIVILKLEEDCDHSVQYGGLCAKCGISLDQKDYLGYSQLDRAPIAMSHGTQGLTVSRTEAEQLENASTKRLLEAKKLILIVDLDQTVIHAAVDPSIGQWINDPESPHHEAVKDVRSFMLREQRRDGLVNCWYYIKLRPGLKDFLEKMSKLFELHIYTMATKAYALEIAKIVDPEGKFFGDRILGREESGSMVQKNLKRLFPVTTQLVCIIDDRGDVWNWSSHLVRVVPYNFFEGTGDINSGLLPKRAGLITPDSGAGGPGENDEQDDTKQLSNDDTELSNIDRILTTVHDEFFADLAKGQSPDVGQLLPRLKEPVFSGCVFLFSGIFPLGVSLENADIVKWVRSFGALVVAQFVPAVTHVVANTGGTVKTRQAAGAGIPVVSTNWLFACLKEWSRVPTSDFLISVPDPIKPEDVQVDKERVQEPEQDEQQVFAKNFSGGGVDWDEMNKELEEFMTSEEEGEDKDKEGEPEGENVDAFVDVDNFRKPEAASEAASADSLDLGSRPTSSKRPRSNTLDGSESVSKKPDVFAKSTPEVQASNDSKPSPDPSSAVADGPDAPSDSDSDADLAAELELDFAQSN